jgi:membrane-associated phospholipid phosphatase
MSEVLAFGIQMIAWFQNLGEWLVIPFKGITFLGNEEFFLLLAPAIYWCLDARLGLRLGLFLMTSGSLNSTLKILAHAPRPAWIDPTVKAYVYESSFGIPSGHSQNAAVIWGMVAANLRRRWSWIAAGGLVLLIGLSRIFLAAHFPTDVLAAWMIGILLLWLFLKIDPALTQWINKQQPTSQVIVALLTSLGFILLGLLARLTLGSWKLPSIWISNSLVVFPDEEPITPLALSGMVSNAGAFWGLAIGAIWIKLQGGFAPAGNIWKRLGCYVIGLIGVVLIWRGLGSLLPSGEELIPLVLRYLRYALIGAWVTGLAPWLFVKIKLNS